MNSGKWIRQKRDSGAKSYQKIEIFMIRDSVLPISQQSLYKIGIDPTLATSLLLTLRLEQAMSSARVSAGTLGNGVKEINGVLLQWDVIDRTQTRIVTCKSTL